MNEMAAEVIQEELPKQYIQLSYDKGKEYTYDSLMRRLLDRVTNTVDKCEDSVIYNVLTPMAAELAQKYMEMGVNMKLSFVQTKSPHRQEMLSLHSTSLRMRRLRLNDRTPNWYTDPSRPASR